MMGFLQSLPIPEEREAKNWTNWLVYYIGKLTAFSNDAGSLDERKLVNVKVQLSFGPFVQVKTKSYIKRKFLNTIVQVMFETTATVKEIFKTVVLRTHMKNTGMYCMYLLNGDQGIHKIFTV